MRHILFAALPIALAACQSDPFEQIGYFKDDARNRVFVLQASEAVDVEQVRQKADQLAYTDGQMTMAFVYERDTEGVTDVVTNATGYIEATDAMHRATVPAWRWRFVHQPNGQTVLTDCATEPNEGACRE
jgi:hypothetical protein